MRLANGLGSWAAIMGFCCAVAQRSRNSTHPPSHSFGLQPVVSLFQLKTAAIAQEQDKFVNRGPRPVACHREFIVRRLGPRARDACYTRDAQTVGCKCCCWVAPSNTQTHTQGTQRWPTLEETCSRK
ncbi:hypothetical protein F4803DRAFT_320061 [Xylaria telfairii]|nr:hypothetical protein F4803DRAFT_320061 [Xylaria telfairii]